VLSSQCNPAQALKMLFNPSFYLPKELTKGQSTSVKGALHKYPKVDKTLLNLVNSLLSSLLYQILSNISAIKIKSKIMGAANKESSQTLYKTKVWFPFKKIEDMYSSIAFLESPVKGTYLMIISWSILVLSGNKTLLEAKISSIQDFLEISLDLN
jgi:hypothetical protein